MKNAICAASVMCADLANLERDLRTLEDAGIDELHFDIMDGNFVPNYTLGFDLIKAARRVCKVPCHAHLMIERPERYISRFVEAGCTALTVHVEACTHAHRVLTQIREAGASPGIALNPATSLTKLEYLLPMVERVLVMTVDPGYAGQRILPGSFERVKILRQNIDYHKHRARVEVDGNISVENGARLVQMGADILVLGTASIFKGPDTDLASGLPAFREALKQQAHLV